MNAFSSDVRITNVRGRQKVHTFSGAVTLRDAAGPIDAETFQRADRRAPGREPFTIVADPSVERGGCIVEVGASQIDAQLAPALERMREALFG